MSPKMVNRGKGKGLSTGALALSLSQVVMGQGDPRYEVELPELSVTGSLIAVVEPASTYGAPVSRLELNPQVDLQVRNLAEAQGDVSIRGGIFENTGFRVGAATVTDPQTGHYFAELPIAPEMLEGPDLKVAADNALYGFNSTVGTVDYAWGVIRDGGNAALGFGEHSLNYQRLRQAEVAGDWGVELELSRSESAGVIENGDHNFMRYSGRVQHLGEMSQTDFFAGYQSKYLAWPELYAAPYNSPESDSVRTTLLMVNHRQGYASDSSWEATAYYRRHHDHYLFNRFSDSDAFLHETELGAAAVNGAHRVNERFVFNYMGQVASDKIESTSLENNFTSRDYVKLSLLPEFLLSASGENSVVARVGASYDDTSRDSSKVSPIADLTWNRGENRYRIAYSQTSQVAGYTAIGGSTGGLFASNPDLEREVTRNIEIGADFKWAEWDMRAAAFYRQDIDLVDWTYSDASSSARAARNVDIDTKGIELIVSRRLGSIELLGSATLLDKDEDYGDTSIDASFYALNYAKLRLTAGVVWKLSDAMQLRIDNEYREQRENALREGDEEALFSHVGFYFAVPSIDGLELNLAVENVWDDDFQEVPGTPGRGRQMSLGARYFW